MPNFRVIIGLYFGDRHQAFTKSHNIILTEILPQMNDMDSGYTAFSIERIPEKHRWLYLDLIALFPCGSLRIAHKDGNRYWHPEFDESSMREIYSNMREMQVQNIQNNRPTSST